MPRSPHPSFRRRALSCRPRNRDRAAPNRIQLPSSVIVVQIGQASGAAVARDRGGRPTGDRSLSVPSRSWRTTRLPQPMRRTLRPTPSRRIIGCSPYLLARNALGLARFGPLAVAVPGELGDLAVVLGSLVAVARAVCGARHSEQRAIAVGRLPQRSLEFLQRGSRLTRSRGAVRPAARGTDRGDFPSPRS